MRAGGIAIVWSAFAAVLAVAGDVPKPTVGSQITDLRFKDIRYITRSLDDLGERRANVLVFTNTSCPIAQKYWPKLKRLEENYRSRGAVFAAVNSSEGDTVAEVA